MCGIAGILGDKARNPRVVREMTDALSHRGPDDHGAWADDEAGIALGHRRLSIVDLSPAGHEPMHSASGRFVLTFNGEIYNFQDLRDEIEVQGAAPEGGWRGHSDTEVFLEAIALWGIEATLAKSVGMFAFALWDRREHVLTLVRDRFGEKPLYYGWAGHDLVFGSELKALRAHPSFNAEIDRNALRLFASRAYVPAPLSIYRRVFKLPPGCLLEITPEAAQRPLDAPPAEGTNSGGLSLKRYWSYSDVVTRGLDDPIPDERDALEQLERALASSVRGQSFADVPVGAFLSGGIDSSTVVALYQKHSTIPVRTFSIGFAEAGFNEAEQAKAVARHLGTVHDEHYVSPEEARDVIPLLPAMYDEPFADSSQIPTHLVSRFARQHVTVALTGDGGDELFGGYNRHVLAPSMWRQFSKVPQPVRRMAHSVLGDVSSNFWNRAGSLIPGDRQPGFGSKIQRGLGVSASASSLDDVYRGFLDEWAGGSSPVLGANGAGTPSDPGLEGAAPDAVRMMHGDAIKQFDQAIRAFAESDLEREGWSLAIVGSGPDREALQRTIEAHGLKQAMIYPPTGNLAEYYARASLVVLTSRTESFSLVLAEAMLSGVIPVAYATDGPSFILEKFPGHLVPVGDSERLAERLIHYANLSEPEPLRQALRTSIERRFGEDVIAASWKDLLSEVVPTESKV